MDIRPDTWNIDEAQLEAAITDRTKAIVPVSIYGQCPDMDAVNEVAKALTCIGAAQSFGATTKVNPAIFQPSVVHPSFRPTSGLLW